MAELVTLIVPVFNEETALPVFYRTVREALRNEGYPVEILFVDDGSRDQTPQLIQQLVRQDPLVSAVYLTRNFGKEAALRAGIDYASGEAVIPIDVDLQDPVHVVPLLVARWQGGADMVLAKRIDRHVDSLLKRVTARAFYRVLNAISADKIEENVGDFRLMSRKTVARIQAMPERNLFMKGVMQWAGGRCETVEYIRCPRVAGLSKFNGWKLWNLALDGITSSSTLPLRVWTYAGALVAALAIGYGAWLVARTLVWGSDLPGYASLMAALLFLGGVQLIGIGVMGEYIGRIYAETKSRPRYVVERADGYAQARASGANGLN